MKPKQRQAWMLKYLRDNPSVGGIDAMNYEFEEVYVAATGASHKCIMRDARALHAEGWLNRCTMASTMPYAGSCKWVRHYYLRVKP